MQLRDSALKLAALGWQVFPLHARAKTPATRNGVKDATAATQDVADAWSGDGSAHNIGLATGGLSDVLVLDVDGDEGDQSLRALQALHGALPDTVTVRTARGRHLYFRYPGPDVRIRNSAGKLAKGLDVRTDGGYVVAPPSVHPDGTLYAWETDPFSAAPADMPEWLVKLLVDKPREEPKRTYEPRDDGGYGHTRYGRVALEAECRELASRPEGGRNDRLNGVAFRIGQLVRARHLNELMARAEVMSAAKSCGLEDSETRGTFASGFKAGYDNPNPSDPDPDAPPPQRTRPASAYRPSEESPHPGDDDRPPEQAREQPAPPMTLTAEQTASAALNYLTDEKRARLPRTGYARLDDALGGFPPGTMTTIGGRTGAGKSSLLLGIAMNQSGPKGQGHKVGIVSCEDSEWIWGARIMAALDDVNPERFFQHPPDPYLVGRALLAVQSSRDYGVHFGFAIGKPLRRILEIVTHMIDKQGCTVVMVDYLQAISCTGQDRYTARTDAAQAIKGLCHDKGAALVLASQLKRPEVGSPYREPNSTDLKDSGDIENMSEGIVLLWPKSDEERAVVLGKVSKVKWSFRRPRFALERNPKTGALVSIVEPPSAPGSNGYGRSQRGMDEDD